MIRKYFWSIVLSCGAVLVAFLLSGQARLWGQGFGGGGVAVFTPDSSYVYRLEVTGLPTEVYGECSGLGSHSDIDEQTDLNNEGVLVWKATPGPLHWDNITLKHNSFSSPQIWSWRKSVELGQLSNAFKSGSIVLVGANSSQEYARWTFTNGWPARLTLNEGMEELVIVHDGLTLVTPGGGGIATTKKR